jgi:hypothetical protein
MNTPEVKDFIRENSALFWYIPEDKKEEVSHELLIETIFNYGDMKAVLKLFELLGINYVAEIFFNLEGRKKLNYYPEIYSYFVHVLKTFRYA